MFYIDIYLCLYKLISFNAMIIILNIYMYFANDRVLFNYLY